jgi:hypothetical protein
MKMGYRNRNMYYLTGLPGWVRFGFSPGWVGRSPTGLPPTAQWLIQSGLMPQYLSYLGTAAPTVPSAAVPPTVPSPGVPPTAGAPTAPTAPFYPTITKEQEKTMLEQQVKALESQLEAIRKRLEEIGKGA